MHEYSVNNIKYTNTRRGVSYTADLLMANDIIAQISNDGDGSSTVTRFIKNENIKHFISTAEAVCVDSFEHTADFAELLITQAECQ